jgi:hypothetical protein
MAYLADIYGLDKKKESVNEPLLLGGETGSPQ